MNKSDLIKINDYLWEIPKKFRVGMKVPARIYASEKMLDEILTDKSLEQLANVAFLTGIQKYALVMPDAHEGYGFPIGGVAAFSAKNGVISPGGIGYDINCGVRVLKSALNFDEAEKYLKNLGNVIYDEVPSGVGKGGRLKLGGAEFDAILEGGAPQMVKMGYGTESDLRKIESGGCLENADAKLVSDTAKKRGYDQLGTMGAGNHFVEVDVVEKIFNKQEAEKLGLFENQIVVLIHTGSRGLGHQIATDYIRAMMKAMPKYGIEIPDRELACAPFDSDEGQNYFKAMACGANFAWANRQMITWEVRNAWKKVFGENGELEIVYDVAHNIAKVERYKIGKEMEDLVVHRKGATRSFPGQPVIIPGSMGTNSYILVGREKSLEESFGSSCHGAGRVMSRTQAKREISGMKLKEDLLNQGIHINTGSFSGLAEEAPQAYKNVDDVVDVVHNAGLAEKVARLNPVAVIKG